MERDREASDSHSLINVSSHLPTHCAHSAHRQHQMCAHGTHEKHAHKQTNTESHASSSGSGRGGGGGGSDTLGASWRKSLLPLTLPLLSTLNSACRMQLVRRAFKATKLAEYC